MVECLIGDKIRTLNISSDLLPEFLVWQTNMCLTSRERRCLSSPQIQLITAQTTAACRTWWTVSGIIARCYCELWNHISNACLLLSAQEVHWATPRDTKSSATSGSALGLMLPSAPCRKRRTDPAGSKCCLWEMFALNRVSFTINRKCLQKI